MNTMADIPEQDAPNEELNKENENPQPPDQLSELSEVEILNAKIGALEVTITQIKDQFLRKAADFENYKKRVENDGLSLIKFSNEELIMKLLPVIDDFERLYKASQQNMSTENPSETVFMKGVDLIYNKFKKILENQGVKPFDVVGKPFDPELHDALLQMPRSDVAPHTVIEEVDKGYMHHDRVIRHARVVVSGAPLPENGKSEPGEAT